MDDEQKTEAKNKNTAVTLSWKLIAILLAIVIVVMLFLWKPWVSTISTTRKISVTGTAKVKAVPDEYVLSPYFEFANADRTKANAELTAQGTAITAKLKELGVKDEQIKSNTNGYDKYAYPAPADNSENILMLTYTITLNDKDMAQKVQDYMLSLKAKGQISPQATFSESKLKELQATAKEKAIEDAKKNADSTAKQLNAKVGKVILVSDGPVIGGGPIAVSASGAVAMDTKLESGTISSVPVQVGQDEVSYVVSVEYELK